MDRSHSISDDSRDNLDYFDGERYALQIASYIEIRELDFTYVVHGLMFVMSLLTLRLCFAFPLACSSMN